MMVDGKRNPIGLYRDGGTSPAGEKDTTMVCGRLDRCKREEEKTPGMGYEDWEDLAVSS